MSIQEILKAADGANIMLSVTPSDLKEFALTIIEETMNNIATSEVGHEDFMRDLMSQRETRKKLDVTNSTLWRWDKEKQAGSITGTTVKNVQTMKYEDLKRIYTTNNF